VNVLALVATVSSYIIKIYIFKIKITQLSAEPYMDELTSATKLHVLYKMTEAAAAADDEHRGLVDLLG